MKPSSEMPEELKAKRDELARHYDECHPISWKQDTHLGFHWKRGFDKCYELMMMNPEFQPLAKRLDWQIKKCMESEEREAKLKAKLEKAIDEMKSIARLLDTSSCTVLSTTLIGEALKEIEEAGR